MTNLLYMKNIESNYLKEFYAIVTKKEDDYICLDNTAFYPEGGGQPSDTGIIKWNNHQIRITNVIKKGNAVKHMISDKKPSEGTKIHGILDWDKRYKHMKMHTAQHIISGIIYDKYNAKTVGNQITSEYSRVDFYPLTLSNGDIAEIEDTMNKLIQKNLPIKIYDESRGIIEKQINQQRCNLDLLPKFIDKLRIVEIEGFDICPCAGTHVKNTSELSPIKIYKKESQGKDKERMYYKFV